MFDIGLPELFVIALIALIVFGPERLPEMASQFAKWISVLRVKLNSATSELKSSADVAGLSEIANELKGLNPKTILNDQGNPPSESEIKVVFDPDAT